MKKSLTQSLAVLALCTAMSVASLARAQSWHRQDQKEQWKDLAIGSGVVGLLGILTHNDTLTGLGAAGAIYSAYRYDSDGQCFGERFERGRAVWVRVPDRDRDRDRHDWDRDRNRERDWNRNQDRNRDDRGWHRH